jgi:uncharacterized MAPEG superfamily protein
LVEANAAELGSLGVTSEIGASSMTVPTWMLLGFAAWTVLRLLSTVGAYRWSRILTGSVPIREFRADHVEGEDWYRRSMRAHANRIENLPVFGAIVLALYVAGVGGPRIHGYAPVVIFRSKPAQLICDIWNSQKTNEYQADECDEPLRKVIMLKKKGYGRLILIR